MSHPIIKNCRSVLRLAAPLITSRLMNSAVNFLGMLMIARLGHDVLAASALGFSIYAALIMLGYGFIYGTGILIANAFGAKEHGKVGQIVRHGLVFCFFIFIPIFIALWFVGPILTYFGQKPVLVNISTIFLRAFSISALPGFFYILLTQYVSGVSRAGIINFCSAINIPLNLTLLYGFIYGKLGFPSLGVWGIGISYAISFAILGLILLAYTVKSDYFKPFALFKRYQKPAWWGEHFAGIIKLGGPMSIQYGAEIAVFAIATVLIGTFGEGALAAAQIASQMTILAIMVPFGLSQASAILVGQAYGAKDSRKIREVGVSTNILAILFLTVIALILLLFPHVLIGLYINTHHSANQLTVHLALLFLIIAAFSQWFDGLRNVVTGSLRGMHDAKMPMYVGIFVTWFIGLPLGSLLAFVFHFGPVGMNLGFAISVSVGMVILLRRFYRLSKSITF